MIGKDLRGIHVGDAGFFEVFNFFFWDPDGLDAWEELGAFFVRDFKDAKGIDIFSGYYEAFFEITLRYRDFLKEDAVGVFFECVIKAEVDAREWDTEVLVEGFANLDELAVKGFGIDVCLDGVRYVEHEGNGECEFFGWFGWAAFFGGFAWFTGVTGEGADV